MKWVESGTVASDITFEGVTIPAGSRMYMGIQERDDMEECPQCGPEPDFLKHLTDHARATMRIERKP